MLSVPSFQTNGQREAALSIPAQSSTASASTIDSMNFAFLTSQDPHNKRTWSGTYYYMAQALIRQGIDVTFLGPTTQNVLPLALFNQFSQAVFNKRYDYRHSPVLAKKYAKAFSKKLSCKSFDFIFAPGAATEIAFLETDIPIIYSSDVTFSLAQGYYPEYSNLLQRSTRNGNMIENLVIKKADYLVYPSRWVADAAIRDYSCDPSKVHLIPYGANLDHIPPAEVILEKQHSDVCRLLFLGVDWNRKGGEIAFETLLELQKMGVPAELVICGCIPPRKYAHKNMTIIPFLDKNDPAQSRQLEQLLLRSSFLLVPARKEFYGVVFCEAGAYGLPCISTDTGGIPVENSVNGYRLSPNARGDAYATIIRDIYMDRDRYRKLIVSSREKADKELNWDSWAKSVQIMLNRRGNP